MSEQGTTARAQVALVTGASSGIGRATARALAARGWSLVLCARSADGLAAVEAECVAAGAPALAVPTDVGDRGRVEDAFAAATERFGRVDAVVNSAAVVGYGRFEDVPAEVYDRVVTTNLLGTANVARAALAHFKEHGGGRLVLIGSLLGKIAVPFMSPYVTSKWGVQALARTLQVEARETPGIQVSLVSPGSINTPAYLQAANYAGWEGRPPPPIDPPEKVAAAVLRCLDRPRRDEGVGVFNPVVVLGFRMLPALYDLLVTPLAKVGALSRRALEPFAGTVFEPRPAAEEVHGVWDRWGRRRSEAPPSGTGAQSGATGDPGPATRAGGGA
ncbi:SDR family NAD(P)-dependent oxidoreductase [Nakamurella endophytica]|uniref:Short-chain dehydrogenase n=1 Tax=Nakamurella endophytica TaxID=1748367 RepID=A0A917TAT4_9ACTN|nr:SDR family NAD(P)-dependent oxidoreductase [Nakamurella endophytica]GGM16698.1 short-chain dehydrogenase [Nakamurella endophytica]